MKKFLFIIFFFSVCMQAQEIREVKGKTICCDAAGNTLTADVIESRASNGCWVVLSSDYDKADGDCEMGLEAIPNNVMGGNCQIYTFMSHNLGADESHDAMTPGWQLNGAYYQWNRKDPVAYAPTATDDDPGVIGTWDSSNEPGTEWESANDPCPEGYSIPSKAVWDEVIKPSNNTWANVGTWSTSQYEITNYSSGKTATPRGVGSPTLYLPASGLRSHSSASLYHRGSRGYYWGGTQGSSTYAYTLYFSSSFESVFIFTRNYGFSVRCLAD